MMAVPGAFFEVTGKDQELDRIFAGIEANSGRLTYDESATLDLWLEMKEEWFKLHDAEVRSQLPVATLDGATERPAEGAMIGSAGEFSAVWNATQPEERERLWKSIQDACNDGYQCHVQDHATLQDDLERSNQRRFNGRQKIQILLDGLYSQVKGDTYAQLKAIQEAL